MGDLLMSAPAITAIKKTFRCKITVLCSDKAEQIAAFIEGIDEVLVFNLPWLKLDMPEEKGVDNLIEALKQRNFDACIVFNVYSQNPAPCLLLAYMAGIEYRAAYSRENLYGLITHWLPDDEPLQQIRHQVERDLNLAKFLGATIRDERIRLAEQHASEQLHLLDTFRLNPNGYFVLHTGVSEKKRRYPESHWIALGKLVVKHYKRPVVLTGSESECVFIDKLAKEMGAGAISLAGQLPLKSLLAIIKNAIAMVSVNTGPMHLAVALDTPLVALYAQTNPQHKPFKARCRILEYAVTNHLQSANEIIRFVNDHVYVNKAEIPSPEQVMEQLQELLFETKALIPGVQQAYNQDF